MPFVFLIIFSGSERAELGRQLCHVCGQDPGWWGDPDFRHHLAVLTRCFSFAPSTCSWPSRGSSSWWASSWCWAPSWGATCASVCTWPPPTRPLTSGTKATGPGASSVPMWPGPQQRSPGPTGTSTPVGSGATFERSFCLLLCVTRERRNRDGKSVTAF